MTNNFRFWSKLMRLRTVSLLRSLRFLVRQVRPRVDHLIILLTSAGYVSFWLYAGSLPFGANSAPSPQPRYLADHFLYAWNMWIDNGNPIPLVVSYPVHTISILVLTQLSFSYLASLGLFMTFWLFVGATSTYHLTKLLGNGDNSVNVRIASVISGFLYVFNFYWISIAGDIVVRTMVVASIPLLFYSYASALKRNSIQYAILGGVAALIMGQGFPSSAATFILSSLGIGAMCLYFILVRGEGRSDRLLRVLRVSLVFLAVSASLSMYLIVSFLITQQNYLAALASNVPLFFPEPPTFAAASSPINAIRFIPWTWFTDTLNPRYVDVYLTNPIFFLSTFVLPVLAFSNLLIRGNKRVTLVTVLAAFAVFLATGSTTLPSASFWSLFVNSQIGKIVYVSSVTGVLSPFVMVAYCTLGSISLARLLKPSTKLRVGDGDLSYSLVSRHLARTTSAIGILVLVMLSVFPVYSGQAPQWHANAYFGNGVELPSYYGDINTWLAAHTRGGNVLIAPSAGLWPTLQWGNRSGYQGINPYPTLLSAAPIITGAGFSYGASTNIANQNLISLAYSSVEDPALLMSFSGPCLTCDNLAGNITGWTTEQGYHNVLAWDNSASFYGSKGVFEFVGNNSASYGNPNGNGVAYRFRNPIDFAYHEFIVWVRAEGLPANSLSLVIGVGSGGGGYHYSPQTSVALDGWSEVVFRLDPSTHPLLSETNAVYIVYSTPDASGYTKLWIGSAYAEQSRGPDSTLTNKILTMLNVEYVLVDSAIADSNSTSYYRALGDSNLFKLVLTEGKATIYQNVKWSGGFYVASVVKLLSTTKELVDYLMSEASPYSTILISSPGLPGTEPAQGSNQYTETNLVPIRASPTSYIFDVVANGTFFFVLSQSFSHDWIAEVNGSRVSTHFLANLYANGWLLSSGTYRLVVNYLPQQAYLAGVVTSVSSTMALLVLFLVTFVRESRKPPKKSVTQVAKSPRSSDLIGDMTLGADS